MKLFRIIVAAPFILLGALLYKIGELISGEIYVRHEKRIRENVIAEHGFHHAALIAKHGTKGFRQPRRKK